jgi:two-component system, LytTR family, sensor kinase
MEWKAGPDGLVRAYRTACWKWIVGAWGAILLFETARHCIDVYRNGRYPSTLWITVTATTITLWCVITPFMMWMGRHKPLQSERRARWVVIHAATLLTIVMIDAALQSWLWGNRVRSTFGSICLGLIVIDGFSYATVIAIGHVQRSNEMYRERVRAQAALAQELTTARLRALEMQLQPHFLFNTLHAVGALVRSARPDDAVRSLATLGSLLRATLTGGDQHEIALVDELALAQRYLTLQKIRFADRLQVDIAIAPEVERARVPRLILQPLLENAVRHGVERSRTPVTVEVRATARDGRLELLVRDHGGVREAPLRGHGIGMTNTRARLATLYGTAYELDVTPTEGGGVAVRIEIPLTLATAGAPVPDFDERDLILEGQLTGELEAAT